MSADQPGDRGPVADLLADEPPGWCFDREGQPIGVVTLARLLQDPEYRIIGRAEVDGWEISTVWLGIHVEPERPPVIFETAVLGSDGVLCQARYVTVEEARTGHEGFVALATRATEQGIPLDTLMAGLLCSLAGGDADE